MPGKLPGGGSITTTLAHTARGITEAKWNLGKGEAPLPPVYGPRIASRARKTIASLPDEQGTQRTLSSKGWTGRKRQVLVARGSGENLCKHCVIMWRQTGGTQTVRNTSMVQLFGDEMHCGKFLEFLAATEVGLRGRRRGRRMTEGGWPGEEESDRR
jgi:hypothetical protein